MKHCYPYYKALINIQNTKNGRGIYNILIFKCLIPIKIIIFLILFFVFTENINAQGTYTWNGATTDFQVASNWTPSRSALNAGDILIFQNKNQTVTNVPTQTVASITLQVSGGAATITLQGALAASVLTLSSATNALVVNATCGLTIGTNMTIALSGTSTNAGTITVANIGS